MAKIKVAARARAKKQERAHTKKKLRTPAPRFGLSVDEAAAAVPTSRSQMYEFIGEGRIKTKRLGDRLIIPVAELARFIDSLPNGETPTLVKGKG